MTKGQCSYNIFFSISFILKTQNTKKTQQFNTEPRALLTKQ